MPMTSGCRKVKKAIRLSGRPAVLSASNACRNAIVLVAFLLAGLSAPARADESRAGESFEQTLLQADQLRSSNAKSFATLLDNLEARQQAATPLQRQRLNYLQVYRQAVYGTDLRAVIVRAQALFEETADPDLRFRTGSLIANLFVLERNFGDGLRYLDRTMPLRDRVGNDNIRHDGINSAAQLYNELGQYELGLRYAQETLAEGPGPRASCFANVFRLEALVHLDRLPPEEDGFHDVVRICQAASEELGSVTATLLLARRKARAGAVEDAAELLRGHIDGVEAIGYKRLIGEAHALYAELLLKTGDTDGAERHARAAIKAASGIPNSLPLVVAHKVMYEIANRRGDPVAALSSYRLYSEADRAYINEIKARELVYQIVRQESAEKTQRIELLNQRNNVLTLQREVDRQASQNTRLVASLLALLVGLVGFWAYKIKRLHASLRTLAETDALTGISNRHHFTLLSEASLAQSERTGESVALLMFDLDHFKAINDNYGHVTGDWVLKQVALACQTFCRRIDHLGRVGGEEFAILLQGCDLQSASRLADDCRVRLSRIDTRESGHSFAITASFGVSATATSGYALGDLMSHADLMLYRAKREGRNRVRMYVPDLLFVPPSDLDSSADPASAPAPSRAAGNL